jgi:hypothetical protein
MEVLDLVRTVAPTDSTQWQLDFGSPAGRLRYSTSVSGQPIDVDSSVAIRAFSSTDSHTRVEILPARLACQRGARLRSIAEAGLAL